MAAKWTFMVYMAGFNNLTDFATLDLEEMRKVGSTDDVKVAVFIKRLDSPDALHIIVGKGGVGETEETIANADSGDPQTMLDFVRWTDEKAPAEKYALVVWNHGSGWGVGDLDQLYSEVRAERGDVGVTPRELGLRSTQDIDLSLFKKTVKEILGMPTAGLRAIASDDGTGHSLDTIELGNVLAAAAKELGGPLALLGMDACLMSTLEVAFQARASVQAVVGSEELEPGDGWPYTEILRDLSGNPAMTGAELGAAVVGRYVESYQHRDNQWPITQAAVQTAHLDEFAGVIDDLATAMQAHLTETGNGTKILRAQSKSTTFTGDLVDLRTFCNALIAGGVDESVEAAAHHVLAELEPGRYVVAEGHLGPTVEGCGGISLYFPSPLDGISKYYQDLDFAERGWDDFLSGYQRAIRGD